MNTTESELLICPFCGSAPVFPDAKDVLGTCYEAGCEDCGMARADLQIIDCFDYPERSPVNESWDNNPPRYGLEYVEIARQEAINRWNERQPAASAEPHGFVCCAFEGDPPEPYQSWPEWCSAPLKTNAFIRAATGADFNRREEGGAEPVAWLSECLTGARKGQHEIAEAHEEATNTTYWTDAFPVYRHPPAPQEPVAWMDAEGCLHTTSESAYFGGKTVTPLYAQPPAPQGWQDISSAPKDGTWIDLWVNDGPVNYRIPNARWSETSRGSPVPGWHAEYMDGMDSDLIPNYVVPTHWMAHTEPGKEG